MNIALIGATGNIGGKILAEALSRAHRVTAISRDPERLTARDGLVSKQGDIADTSKLTSLLVDHDAVIVSVRFGALDARALLNSIQASGVKRLIVVGGAGSLLNAHGVELVDAPGFPEASRAGSLATRNVLNLLKSGFTVDWTYLSPPQTIGPGERTGNYRLGKDQLLVDVEGKSWISREDYAVALLDELERPRHVRQRFTVGY